MVASILTQALQNICLIACAADLVQEYWSFLLTKIGTCC